MKYNIKLLLLWIICFYFVLDPLRNFLAQGTNPFDIGLESFQDFYLTITTLLTFYFFSVMIYTVLFYFMPKKHWLYIILLSLVSFFVVVLSRYLIQQTLADMLFGFVNYRRDLDFIFYLRDHIYYFIIYGGLGLIYYFQRNNRYRDGVENALVIANQKMELSLLRSQINPHFLLNTLNNIYSLVYMKSEKALPALDKLSDILKYTLYENQEKVELEKEISYLNNYIDLQKMRYEKETHIIMNIDDKLMNKEVPQFLLVPLIENAFKHGELTDESVPMEINISQESHSMVIVIRNKIRKQLKDSQGGIGLENVRKRLSLIYGTDQKLTIDESNSIFTITMNIPLS